VGKKEERRDASPPRSHPEKLKDSKRLDSKDETIKRPAERLHQRLHGRFRTIRIWFGNDGGKRACKRKKIFGVRTNKYSNNEAGRGCEARTLDLRQEPDNRGEEEQDTG